MMPVFFSLGYANAMMFTNIGTLDTRSHQCADAKGVFEFSDYFAFRIITCLFYDNMFHTVCKSG